MSRREYIFTQKCKYIFWIVNSNFKIVHIIFKGLFPSHDLIVDFLWQLELWCFNKFRALPEIRNKIYEQNLWGPLQESPFCRLIHLAVETCLFLLHQARRSLKVFFRQENQTFFYHIRLLRFRILCEMSLRFRFCGRCFQCQSVVLVPCASCISVSWIQKCNTPHQFFSQPSKK